MARQGGRVGAARRWLRRAAAGGLLAAAAAGAGAEPHSVARRWNEALLEATRNDFARPPIHARNLFHVSAAMWDAWAVYDDTAEPLFLDERLQADDVQAARREAISYAAYRVLYRRYQISPGAYVSLPSFDDLLTELGYDYRVTEREGNSPAAVGNRIAKLILDRGYDDGADELGSYAFEFDYRAANPPLVVAHSGAGELADPNRWQPLSLRLFVDQAGRVQPGRVQRFIGSHWGSVTSFALPGSGMAAGDGVFHDPGPPPFLGGERAAEYRTGFAEVLRYAAALDPDDGVAIDISPRSRGGNSLGANDGRGYAVNPVTGQPYEPNVVKRGDWARVIAEFWADGPDSETPPGHWNSLANYVTDHPLLERRLLGEGPLLDPLEWDVKLYLALNGAVHDAAVCAWGLKGHYDYVRPITAIRHMAGLGQSSDPELPSWHPDGLPLEPGLAELITRGQRRARRAPRPSGRARGTDRRLLLAGQAGGTHRLQRRRLAAGRRLGALSARHLRHPAIRRLRLRPQHLQPRRGGGAGAVHRQRVLSRRPGGVRGPGARLPGVRVRAQRDPHAAVGDLLRRLRRGRHLAPLRRHPPAHGRPAGPPHRLPDRARRVRARAHLLRRQRRKLTPAPAAAGLPDYS